ncbi:MAG: HU family DNA-binding protein [Rectinemataceae bacterium]|nr:integration host factor subunit beta [Spirochaetaceae bacterium]
MAEKLTKAELIDALYDSLSPSSRTTRKEIHELIDGLFAEIKSAILNGKVVELRGFGTFEVKLRKGRAKARNPKTGEIVAVSDHGVASFRPGRELKKAAWEMDTTLIPKTFKKKE